jgi:hypothetical protein
VFPILLVQDRESHYSHILKFEREILRGIHVQEQRKGISAELVTTWIHADVPSFSEK